MSPPCWRASHQASPSIGGYTTRARCECRMRGGFAAQRGAISAVGGQRGLADFALGAFDEALDVVFVQADDQRRAH